jgi:hypothetical protein
VPLVDLLCPQMMYAKTRQKNMKVLLRYYFCRMQINKMMAMWTSGFMVITKKEPQELGT